MLTRQDFVDTIDRDDPRLPYFLRLSVNFTRRKGAELDRAEMVALWEAAERSRLIDAHEQERATVTAIRRNYGVGPSVVYYVQHGNLIKIGTSTNVIGRMSSLQIRELIGLEPGGVTEEHARHRQFAALRLHDEWFHPGSELLAHIATLPQGWREIAATVTLVSVEVAAKVVGVDRTTVWRWADKGIICKYGRMVDQHEVEIVAQDSLARRGLLDNRAGLQLASA